MRFMQESLEGKVIEKPDFAKGKIEYVNNPVIYEFKKKKEAVVELECIKEYKNEYGEITGKDFKQKITPAEGEWRVYEMRNGKKVDITDSNDFDFTAFTDVDRVYTGYETVGIYIPKTKKELEAEKKQRAAYDKSLEEQEMLKRLLNRDYLKEVIKEALNELK